MICRRNLTYSEKDLSHCHFANKKKNYTWTALRFNLGVHGDKLHELWNELQIFKEMVKLGVCALIS
jgi:hypothetical protein